MLRKLFNRLGSTLYVQIWSSHIKVTDVRSGQVFDEAPLVAIKTTGTNKRVVAIGNQAQQCAVHDTVVTNPFLHPRVLFADFVVGEELLKHIIHALSAKRLIVPAPLVVIHAMEKTEGGLTYIERRAFMELAEGAGARRAYVYEGPELPIAGFEAAFLATQPTTA